MAGAECTILHVDMDAFYASVEQRDHPELRGRPVIVGGLGGRGVVCAASYEARAFGIRSAMPMATAHQLCPHADYLPIRMHHYVQIAQQIRDILTAFTPLVEPLSLDEAFLDVGGVEGLFGPAPDVALQIKERIHTETKLVASVGVAPNKFLAKLASDHGKPNGFVVLKPEWIASFLAPLPVSRVWGVGPKGEKRLRALGIDTIGQLAAWPESVLMERLGPWGSRLWHLAHGHDDRPVTPDREAKSISTETTFAYDISDRDILRDWLLSLVDQLASRLRKVGLKARAIELKVRWADFSTRTRSRVLPAATDSTDVLARVAGELLGRCLSANVLPIRLLGVGASKFTREPDQQDLFFDNEAHGQSRALDRAVDAIRSRFGPAAIRRGNHLDRPGH